jgi:hypothetical protein
MVDFFALFTCVYWIASVTFELVTASIFHTVYCDATHCTPVIGETVPMLSVIVVLSMFCDLGAVCRGKTNDTKNKDTAAAQTPFTAHKFAVNGGQIKLLKSLFIRIGSVSD